MKRDASIVLSCLSLLVLLALPAHAGVWGAASLGVGAGGGWLAQAGEKSVGNFEAVGKGAVSLTPHVSVVGGIAYGFQDTYLRGSVGARITATDVNDRTFSIGIGISKHFASEQGFSLNEWAAEAAIGWKPLASSEFIVTGSAARGLDSGDAFLTAAAVYPMHLPGGGQ